DHVNPERPWPQIDALAGVTAAAGFTLRERLTAYPPYVRAGVPWLDPRVLDHVRALSDVDGLAVEGVEPQGRAWQGPDGGWASTGRSDRETTIDTTGRSADRRADFDEVYGDWAAVGARADWSAPERLDADVRAALRSAERDPAGLSDADALALLHADGAE